MLPDSLRQAVWWPLSAFDGGAVLIDRAGVAIGKWRKQGDARGAGGSPADIGQVARRDSASSMNVAVRVVPSIVDAVYLQRNIVGLSAALAMIIGFFMPWVRIFGNNLSGAGLVNMGDEGVVVWIVAIGASLVIVLYFLQKANRVTNVIVGALPGAALLLEIVSEWEMRELVFEVLAIGVWVTVGAGIVLALAPIKK